MPEAIFGAGALLDKPMWRVLGSRAELLIALIWLLHSTDEAMRRGSAALFCCYSVKILWKFDPYRLDNCLPSHTLISLGFQGKLKKKKKKKLILKHSFCFGHVPTSLSHTRGLASPSMEKIPKYSSHFSQKLVFPWALAQPWAGCEAKSPSVHTVFFLPGCVSIKSSSLAEPQKMRRRGKKNAKAVSETLPE